MMSFTKPRKLAWRLLQLSGCAFALLLALTLWWVTGPATEPHPVDPSGVPPGSWPALSASVVEDLPLSCSPVVMDRLTGAREHRNHVYLAKHGDRYFVMFTSWLGAEDQPGSEVHYATSPDGIHWSVPEKLASPAPQQGVIARGFVQREGKLFAWYAAHTGDTFFRDDTAQADRNIAILESEWKGPGKGWAFKREVLAGYLNNYAPKLYGKDLVMAVRDTDRAIHLATSRNNGADWTLSQKMPAPPRPAPGKRGLYLADEPVVLDYANGNALVLLRNNNSADERLWAAGFAENAWRNPYPLSFAADSSKFLPVTLADGQSAIIGNFNPDVRRALLHIALSKDGRNYDRLYRLSLEGQYANLRWRSPQYPHAIVDGNTMLLAVSYGKRAISVCRGPANAKDFEDAAEFRLAPRIASAICSKKHPTILRRLFGYAGCTEHFVWG